MQLQTEIANPAQAELPTPNVGLRVVDLRKSFTTPKNERINILRGITFEVKPGESVSIMGASGSGKSTLLHLLGGLDLPDHGSVTVDTNEIGRMRARDQALLRQRRIGFVFQFHYLLTDLNAVENVAMPLLISRTGRRAALAKSRQLLNKLGLEDRADYPVSHLSGGEQQRVAVARAIIRDPRLLLADEPTGNLDTSVGELIGRTLIDYTHEHGAMAVIATHNEHLARLCDRLLILESGRIYPG